MNILDRLKSQPPWRDPDPLVRVDGIYEIPDEDQDLLASIAREDADPRVRQAVAPRLQDPSVLAELVRSDADPDVQAAAGDALASVACEASDEARALSALAGVTDSRHVLQVAKHASYEAIGLAALDRLADEKVMPVLAKQSELATVRLGATSRVDDLSELSAIAQNSEHKDSALAALERVNEPEFLKSIAARAKNKVAGRRAKSMLRAVEERSSTPNPDAPAVPPDERLRDLCTRLEGLASLDDEARLEAELTSATPEWLAVRGETPDAQLDDHGLAGRFEAACAALRERVALLSADRIEQERLADERLTQLAPHRALCDSVEALAGDLAPDRVTALKTEWAALPIVEGPIAEELANRFQKACSAIERGAEQAAADARRHDRLEALLAEAEAIGTDLEVSAAVAHWGRLQKEWRSLTGEAAPGPEHTTRVEAIDAAIAARVTGEREARTRTQQEAVARLTRLAERLEGQTGSDQTTLKAAERAMRDIRTTLDRLTGVGAARRADGPAGAKPAPILPPKPDRDALIVRFREIQTALFPRLEELRQADDWQRWANASVQEQLCTRMEALAGAEDLAAAARQLRLLQDEWKKVKTATPDRSESLWHRFKTAAAAVRERCQPHFAERALARASNHEQKQRLCEQVEALADSSDWIRTADAIKKLQAEWKGIGPGLHEKATWERFRSACDRFFTRRKEDLGQRKKTWSANLTAKIALCEQAETLAGSTDWEATAAAIRKLQAEWKATGPVQRSRAEAIWKRFRTACDQFYENYQGRDVAAKEANIAERESICSELEGLLPASDESAPAATPDGFIETVRSLRSRWNKAGVVPGARASTLTAQFDAIIKRLAETYPTSLKGTDLEANAGRLERLCERVESFVKEESTVTSTATLAAQLKEALAANTIGGAVTDESKWRSMTDEVREAQEAFKRVGLVPAAASRSLHERFRRACDRFFDQRRKYQPQRPPSNSPRQHPAPRRGQR